MIIIKKILRIAFLVLGIALIILGICIYLKADYNKIYPSEFKNFINQWKEYVSAFFSEFAGFTFIFIYKYKLDRK